MIQQLTYLLLTYLLLLVSFTFLLTDLYTYCLYLFLLFIA